MMHRRTALFGACLLSMASSLWAQSPLPETIPTATSLSDTDKTAITQLVEESRAGLSGTVDQIKRSRNALVAPLRVRGVSNAFRIEFSRLVAPVVQPLAKSPKEEVAINAARIAGELGTRQGLDILDECMKDSRPGVRMMAALGYVRAFGTAREGSTPLIPAQVRPSLDLIVSQIGTEKDPRVLEALVTALDSAVRVPDANIKDLSTWAFDALAMATGKMAQNASPETDEALAKATGALYSLVSSADMRPSSNALKESALSAGDVIAAVVRRSSGEISPDERSTLGALADQAAKIYYFAGRGMKATVTDYKLGESVRGADDPALKRDAAAIFVSLGGQPFGAEKARYAK
jgi:hypothetical protein